MAKWHQASRPERPRGPPKRRLSCPGRSYVCTGSPGALGPATTRARALVGDAAHLCGGVGGREDERSTRARAAHLGEALRCVQTLAQACGGRERKRAHARGRRKCSKLSPQISTLDNTRDQPRPPLAPAPVRVVEVGHRARTCTGGRARVDLCTREEAEGFSEVMARWWREAREVAASPMLSAEKHGHRVDVAETT